MRGVAAVGIMVALLVAGCMGGGGRTARDPVRISLEQVLEGLDNPVFVTHAGDGSGRLFVVEQGGLIRSFNGSVEGPTFLDVSSKVACCGERGLLGLAFHPSYKDNARLYVYYTDNTGDLVVAEYRATADRSRAEPNTAREILRQAHREYSNHNGGMLAFGPDGMLYAGMGDGGHAGDPDQNAQDLDTWLGKILRIEVGSTCGTLAYCVPGDNPFVGKAGKDEIWHYGLRNPWRFSFDSETGDMWIGDVGQNSVEEVDLAPAGKSGMNFGWSRFEGTRVHNAGRTATGAIPPVAEYGTQTPHCAVTGGYVYRGAGIADLQGSYVFGDYCSGTVWTLRASGSEWVRRQSLDTGLFISSFGEDANGEILVVDRGGSVLRVVAG